VKNPSTENQKRPELQKELNRLLSQSVGNEAEIEAFVRQHWVELNQEPESIRRPSRY
jgi:hypothetical protein